MPDVFISYSQAAADLAKTVAHQLEAAGVRTWVDFKDIAAGENVSDALHQTLREANVYVVIVAGDQRPARRQDFEWRELLLSAWESPEKRVVPVVVGAARPPAFLRNWKWLQVDSDLHAEAVVAHIQFILRWPDLDLDSHLPVSTDPERLERMALMDTTLARIAAGG